MQNPKTLHSYLDRTSAEIAKGHLESEGIEAIIITDDQGGQTPYLSFATGVRLVVDEQDHVKAREILKLEEQAPSESSPVKISPEKLTNRIFICALFGILILPPLILLSLYWQIKLFAQGEAFEKKLRTKFSVSFIINIAALIFYLLVFFVY